jgi:hypothetical protein
LSAVNGKGSKVSDRVSGGVSTVSGEAEQAMRYMDTDYLGHLPNEKVYKVMMDQMKLQQEVFGLKRMSLMFFMVIVLLSVATLVTSSAAVTLAKDTNVVNGNLVKKTDGSLVATRSRGSHVAATIDAGFFERRRRRMLGFQTSDDRRFLQQDGGEVVATVPFQAVVDSYTAFEEDGTPISVSVTIAGVKHTELVAGSGLAISGDKEGETWYRGLHAQGVPEPHYNIHCLSDAEQTCDVYMIGHAGNSRHLQTDDLLDRYRDRSDEFLGEDYDEYYKDPEECFSPIATVVVQGKGVVAMYDLQVGDKVLSANNRFQTVYTFTHMHRTKPSVFLQIYAGEPSEMPVELSAIHMLFLEGKANPVPALLVKVGDVLAGADGPRVVTKIGRVDREGFYAPHTTDGRIMVDGILASAYTSSQGTEYLELFGLKTLSHQTFHDIVSTPFREFCMMVSVDLCNKYTDEDGHNFWDHLGKRIVHFGEKQNILVQIAMYGSMAILVVAANVALSASALATLLFFYVVAKCMKGYWKRTGK